MKRSEHISALFWTLGLWLGTLASYWGARQGYLPWWVVLIFGVTLAYYVMKTMLETVTFLGDFENGLFFMGAAFVISCLLAVFVAPFVAIYHAYKIFSLNSEKG